MWIEPLVLIVLGIGLFAAGLLGGCLGIFVPRRQEDTAAAHPPKLPVMPDLTTEHPAVRTLQTSEEWYRQVFEHVSDIIFVTDDQFVVQLLNPAFTQITGYAVDEVIGKNGVELTSLSPEAFAQIHEDIRTGKARDNIEAPIRTKHGEIRTLQIQVNPIIDGDKLVGFTGIARDVTQLRLRELQEFQTMMEYERLELLRGFVKNASHDLRNPLAIIASSAYLIRRKLTDDSLQPVLMHLNNIDTQVAHLSDQLNNVLTVSELHKINTPTQYIPYALPHVIEAILSQQQAQIAQKQHHLTTHIPDDLPVLMGSPEEIQRALSHLVVNAINYTAPQGTIKIQLGYEDQLALGKPSVFFSITDNGIGISADQQRYIFEPFFRVDSARGLDTGGMGLGLAIARAIIEAHHGEIVVESKLGQGTTFMVYLPLPPSSSARKSSPNIQAS